MKLADDHSDDAINVAPELHEVIFEDEKVRILKVAVKPGDAAKMHWHPRNINYILFGGELKFTAKDGSTREVNLESGKVTNSDEIYHAVENVGEETVETIQIELK